MYSKIKTAVIWGIEGQVVEIETHISRGMPHHVIVGLPSTIIKESKERVKSAIRSSGYKFSEDRITQNLYPAHIKKEGAHLDLPIAIGIMSCLETFSSEAYGFLGELNLEGSIKPVKGVLSLVEGLMNQGITKIVLPLANLKEASCFKGAELYPYDSLKKLIDDLKNDQMVAKKCEWDTVDTRSAFPIDYAQVIGQPNAIRAIQIAVTGFHNILIIGPPGCGKSMIAERLHTIMPDLTRDEKIEMTKIYSVSEGEMMNGIKENRPFRAPHHTISRVGLVGGIQPGEISKAHHGILYLDEIGEFKKDAIDALREPLSNGFIHLTKSGRSMTFPSLFMLVATMNPCPCGQFLSKNENCTCTQYDIKRYFNKLSWPILDRLDMTFYMNRVENFKSKSAGTNITSGELRASIERARAFRTKERSLNLKEEVENIVLKFYDKNNLSMRSYDNLVKIARTIADLDLSPEIEKKHMHEALNYQTTTQVKRLFV